MDPLFTFGNPRKIRGKHIKHVPRNAPRSVLYIPNHEKTILLSQYATKNIKSILKPVPYVNAQNLKTLSKDHIMAVYQ